MNHLVFVYGTLKQGFHNHHLLNDIKPLTCTKTKFAKYNMVGLYSRSHKGKLAPGIHKCENGSFILGEVYSVSPSLLDKLDILEENGTRYIRELTELDSGHVAWLYFHTLLDETTADVSEANQISFDNKNNCYTWILPAS